jgi:plastocyanin
MLRQLATAAFLLAVSAGLIAPAEAATIDVTIAKMAFAPTEIKAQVGDTIIGPTTTSLLIPRPRATKALTW